MNVNSVSAYDDYAYEIEPKKSGEGFVKEKDLSMTASETEGVSEEGSEETAVSVLYSAVCPLTEGTEYYLVFDGTSEKYDRPLYL